MSNNVPPSSMTGTPIAPLVKTVRVHLTPEAAFERFTTKMNDWWPLSTHSVGREEADRVEFGSGVGDKITEFLSDGSTSIWGTIVEWKLGERVVFTWHPSRPESDVQTVAVSFKEIGGATEVELIHSGWEAFGDEAFEMRSNYDGGWTFVLSKFVDAATAGQV